MSYLKLMAAKRLKHPDDKLLITNIILMDRKRRAPISQGTFQRGPLSGEVNQPPQEI